MLASPTARFHLTGRILVESHHHLLDQTELPGRQGRLALVYLVANRHRPIPIDELADALWREDLPRSWEASLRAIISKIRSRLEAVGAPGPVREGGCYHSPLGDAWVDLEAARNAVDRAEGARRRGELGLAWSDATVASAITARPLLDGEDRPWVDDLRRELEQLAIRALDVLCETNLARGDHRLAAVAARRLVLIAPFREAGYRYLMRAEAAAGDPAEALQIYRQLEDLLTRELGARPGPQTQQLRSRLLRSDDQPPGVPGVPGVPQPT